MLMRENGRFRTTKAHDAQEPLQVTLKTAIGTGPTQCFVTQCAPEDKPQLPALELRVLTPAFYSRFMQYSHAIEAFDKESLFTDERNRTIWVSQPTLLPILFDTKSRSRDDGLERRGVFERAQWELHRQLRRPPADESHPLTRGPSDIVDIRCSPFSAMNVFVRTNHGNANRYRRICAKLFLAQRVAFGFTQIIDLLDLALRICMIYGAYAACAVLGQQQQQPKQASNTILLAVGYVTLDTLALNAVHILGSPIGL